MFKWLSFNGHDINNWTTENQFKVCVCIGGGGVIRCAVPNGRLVLLYSGPAPASGSRNKFYFPDRNRCLHHDISYSMSSLSCCSRLLAGFCNMVPYTGHWSVRILCPQWRRCKWGRQQEDYLYGHPFRGLSDREVPDGHIVQLAGSSRWVTVSRVLLPVDNNSFCFEQLLPLVITKSNNIS
jgi:hypothetical protein